MGLSPDASAVCAGSPFLTIIDDTIDYHAFYNDAGQYRHHAAQQL